MNNSNNTGAEMETIKINNFVQITFGQIGRIEKITFSDTGCRTVTINNFDFCSFSEGTYYVCESNGVTYITEENLSSIEKVNAEIV